MRCPVAPVHVGIRANIFLDSGTVLVTSNTRRVSDRETVTADMESPQLNTELTLCLLTLSVQSEPDTVLELEIQEANDPVYSLELYYCTGQL